MSLSCNDRFSSFAINVMNINMKYAQPVIKLIKKVKSLKMTSVIIKRFLLHDIYIQRYLKRYRLNTFSAILSDSN